MKPLHVTDILRIAGLRPEMKVKQEDKEYYLLRGKQIHKACEIMDTDPVGLQWDSVDERIRPFVEGYARFRREMMGDVVSCELKVTHPFLRYVGTIDRVFKNLGGMPGLFIVDLKTNDVDDATAIQTMGYVLAYEAQKKRKRIPCYRRGLALKDDGTYRLVGDKWNDSADYGTFMAALAVAEWNVGHGVAKQQEREGDDTCNVQQ
jgi:hypothetical protein